MKVKRAGIEGILSLHSIEIFLTREEAEHLVEALCFVHPDDEITVPLVNLLDDVFLEMDGK